MILFRPPVASSFRAEQVSSEAKHPSRRSFLKFGCACCVVLATPSAYAVTPSPDVERHLAAARDAAGSDLRSYPALGNSANPNYKPPARSMADLMGMPAPPPGKAFDNLYFVGSKWVSTWALTTSDGIILIDAMDNEEEAERIVEGGLKALGLDPSKVKIHHRHSRTRRPLWWRELFRASLQLARRR